MGLVVIMLVALIVLAGVMTLFFVKAVVVEVVGTTDVVGGGQSLRKR